MDNKKVFSIREVFNFGWNRFGDNALAYIGSMLCAIAGVLAVVFIGSAIIGMILGAGLSSVGKDLQSNAPSNTRLMATPAVASTEDTATTTDYLGEDWEAQLEAQLENNADGLTPSSLEDYDYSTYSLDNKKNDDMAMINFLSNIGSLKGVLGYVFVFIALAAILWSLFETFIQRGLVNMALKTSRGEKLGFLDLFTGGSFWRLYGANILFCLMAWLPLNIVIGVTGWMYYKAFTAETSTSMLGVSILLAILGIVALVYGVIMTIRFYFYEYYIVEQKMGPVKALKAASQALSLAGKTDDKIKARVFLLGLTSLVMYFLGAVGRIWAIVTTPVVYGATAHAYQKVHAVANKSESVDAGEMPEPQMAL